MLALPHLRVGTGLPPYHICTETKSGRLHGGCSVFCLRSRRSKTTLGVMLRQQDAVHLEARPGRRQRSVPRCYGCCSAGMVGGYNSGRLSFTHRPAATSCTSAHLRLSTPLRRRFDHLAIVGSEQTSCLASRVILLAEPSPHPLRDWAHPCHNCARTGQAQMTLLICRSLARSFCSQFALRSSRQ